MRVGHRRRGQDGAVGGIEVIPFGALIFVAGTLLIANAWAVVDAKLAVGAAAREAGRAFVEAPDENSARSAAQHAAASAMAGAGRDPRGMQLRDNHPPFVRCAVVVHEATYAVPAVSIPLIGGFGRGITVHGRHRELLDPYRSGLGAGGGCGG
ncbi:MAG: hypothetical protein JWM47_1457 [Acidimicrobiales bacterium]|nr:hypothetical protein [Acidimicrobiales bacterium]